MSISCVISIFFFLLMNFGLGDKKNGIELNADTQINKNIIFIRSAILRPT